MGVGVEAGEQIDSRLAHPVRAVWTQRLLLDDGLASSRYGSVLLARSRDQHPCRRSFNPHGLKYVQCRDEIVMQRRVRSRPGACNGGVGGEVEHPIRPDIAYHL